MKRKYILLIITGLLISISTLQKSCKVPYQIQNKVGAQLWGENCSRCHNVPSPGDFSDGDWELIGAHMRMRANLTAKETEKIIEFMQTVN